MNERIFFKIHSRIGLTFGDMKFLCKLLVLCFCFTHAKVAANGNVGCGM